MARAWIVRIAEREKFCFQNEAVAIGWARAKGVERPELDWEEFKSLIQSAYPEYRNNYALGQAAGSLWRFVRDIRPNDWIVAPTWTGLHIARVTGALVYDERLVELDSAWRMPVHWIRRNLPRETALFPLQARCASRQICIEATEFLDEIVRLSREEGKPNLELALVRSQAPVALLQVLDDHLSPVDLEHLVAKLAAKGGAQVERPPKDLRRRKGNADVIARYTFPRYAIGFQVKKHNDPTKTDEHAVRQIMEAMEDEELALDIGCVVTTASEFEEAARSLALGSMVGHIRLMTRADLVHWLLAEGISSLR
jgi:predicted Mrr-cat superfamily restriction endonuclease